MKYKKVFSAVKLPSTGRRAFTLIELLVVVAIIGILATVVVVNLSSAQGKSRYAKIVSDMKTVATAATAYQAETGKWPLDMGPGERFTEAEAQKYLNYMPTPPCTGWKYDWNEWLTSGSGDKSINVSVRNAVPDTVFVYCIVPATDIGVCTGPFILEKLDKKITCSEI